MVRRLGYANRSQAICDAIRNFIAKYFRRGVEGSVVGVASFIHEHKAVKRLLSVERSFNDVIIFTICVHLDKENFLEVLVSRRPAERVEGLRRYRG